MSACEKCWTDSRSGEDYQQILNSRQAHPCTAEEQAGPAATQCPQCQRLTVHQYTHEPMCGCVQASAPEA